VDCVCWVPHARSPRLQTHVHTRVAAVENVAKHVGITRLKDRWSALQTMTRVTRGGANTDFKVYRYCRRQAQARPGT
jgi:hypothetical protein